MNPLTLVKFGALGILFGLVIVVVNAAAQAQKERETPRRGGPEGPSEINTEARIKLNCGCDHNALVLQAQIIVQNKFVCPNCKKDISESDLKCLEAATVKKDK